MHPKDVALTRRLYQTIDFYAFLMKAFFNLLGLRLLDTAIGTFELNTRSFPEAFNTLG
ncbi:MAG: hypothetical protein ABJG78_12895 [Cyclobacteriaceae bacterium]